MRLGGARESSNVEDRRGMGIGGGKMAVGGGCGTLIVIILALVFGVDPSQLLSGGGGPVEGPAPAQRTCQGGDPVIEFAPGRGVTEKAKGRGVGLHQ